MPRMTLLADDSATKSVVLTRIPSKGEYIFIDNETLYVERVIHVPKRLGHKALISVCIIETHKQVSDGVS